MPASRPHRRNNRRKDQLQRQRSNLLLLCAVLSIVLVGLIILAMFATNSRPVVDSLTVEAGSALDASQFVKSKNKQAQFVTDISDLDLTVHNAQYHVQVSVNEKVYTCIVNVRDTVAPSATAVPTVITGVLPAAKDLICDIQDISTVTVTYQSTPDITVAGDATAYVLLTDAAGNTAVVPVPVTIKLDTVAPTISVVPFVDHTVYIGDSIAYKSFVTFSDDQTAQEELSNSLKVDRSKVDTAKAGTYDVVYTVTDKAGNSASVTIQLTIKEKPTGYVEPDVAYGYAKQVLDRITTDGMSKAEIAAAIYNYVRHNISYSGSSDKNRGWAAGAVDGFTRGAGDCYTYYATAKALFDVAGIPNVDVVKVKTPQTSQSSHYWSLIDVGNGWYHVDCTPRANNYTYSFFLFTDEEMLAYSRNNKNCFNFDPTAYPERETVSVQSHIQFRSLKVTIKESW